MKKIISTNRLLALPFDPNEVGTCRDACFGGKWMKHAALFASSIGLGVVGVLKFTLDRDQHGIDTVIFWSGAVNTWHFHANELMKDFFVGLYDRQHPKNCRRRCFFGTSLAVLGASSLVIVGGTIARLVCPKGMKAVHWLGHAAGLWLSTHYTLNELQGRPRIRNTFHHRRNGRSCWTVFYGCKGKRQVPTGQRQSVPLEEVVVQKDDEGDEDILELPREARCSVGRGFKHVTHDAGMILLVVFSVFLLANRDDFKSEDFVGLAWVLISQLVYWLTEKTNDWSAGQDYYGR